MKWISMTCAIALIALAGCVHTSTGATPSPMAKITTDNSVFAQLIQTIEQGTEAVTTSGLITPAQAAPVIAWCGNAAQIDNQVTAILAKGSTVSASDYVALQALVTQLGTSASTLISSGAVAVKNPKTQQSINADISAAVTLANGVLTEVQALTVTPAPGGAN